MGTPSDVRRPRALPRDLAALTGLRTIAACAVLGYHLLPAFAAAIPSAGPGVDLFFALSGFVLAHVYLRVMGERWQWRSTLKFWWLRLARIYPVYVATLLVAGVYLALQANWGHTESPDTQFFTLTRFFKQLVFMPEGHRDFSTWNIPAWSILAEAMAYLVFPLLVLALGWLNRRHLPWWLFVAAAMACYAPVVLAASGWWWEFGNHGYHPLMRITCEFPAGALLYLAVVRLRDRHVDETRLARASVTLSVALTAAVAIGIVLLQAVFGNEPWARVEKPMSFAPPMHVQALAPLLGLLIAALALGAGLGRESWLSRRFMVAAGRASYSEYMWH
ncbi:MAG: acyltransferase, partial [Candidatus Nanopelagicales bacterium]